MCGLILVLRLGRLDRKIELPNPDQEARARIMQIHSRKMNVSPDVNFDELSRCTDDYNGAMLKAVCVEAVRAVTEIDHLLLEFKNIFIVSEETVVLRRWESEIWTFGFSKQVADNDRITSVKDLESGRRFR